MAAILEDDAFAEALRGRAGLIAVLDSLQLSGSFAVPYWIKICAERGVRTIVVAVQSSAERYRQLLKRLGLNAGQLVDSQHLCILEPEPPSTSDSDGYLRGLLGRIEGEIEAMAAAAASCSGAPATPVARAASSSAVAAVSVIIDGLSELHGLGWRPHDWHAFLHYLRAAGSRAGLSRRRYSCLAVAHRDVAEDARWLALLQHAADVIVDVEALEGQVAGVRGRVTISNRTLLGRGGVAGAAGEEEEEDGDGDGDGGSDGDVIAAETAEPPVAAVKASGGHKIALPPAPLRTELCFRVADLGMRWLSQVAHKDLLA